MESVSPELERDLKRRLAEGQHESLDDLLKEALRALDDSQSVAEDLLEKEILKGLEGEDEVITAATWDEIERAALKASEAKRNR